MAAILADNIFKRIFLNENIRIKIKISLKFVPKSPIDNKPALVQVMANDNPTHQHIYAVLGGDEFTQKNMDRWFSH